MGFLLLGPVSKDTNIKNGRKIHRIGGAVYYQSKVFSGLGIEHTAAVTLSREDEDILKDFPSKTRINPLFKKETVKFENNYYNNDPNHRIQRSNAPEIPITPADIKSVFSSIKLVDGSSGGVDSLDDVLKIKGVLLGPLLPSDIPLETIKIINKFNIPIYMGFQGYLRHFDGCDIHLEPLKRMEDILKFVEILFLDEKEARAIIPTENSLDKIGKILGDYGPNEVVITCGDRGSIIYSKLKSKSFKIEAFPPLKLIDPTGLGDTFMAAYISCKLLNADPEECGKFAAMVSTIKLESENGFNKNREFVENRLKIENKYEK